MQDIEIQEHEECKQLSIYSYNISNHKLPEGHELIGLDSFDNGFFAAVTRKNNNIFIVYRGSDDINDFKNDSVMLIKHIPAQTRNALDIYDWAKNKYSNCKIIITGHSLGGSLAQIVAALCNAYAVTFNAFGVADFFENRENLYTDKIVNYFNSIDLVAIWNVNNYLGKNYFISSKTIHKIEGMRPLSERVPVSFKDLKKKSSADDEYYQKTGKHSPIKMSGFGLYGEEKCSGKYPVSGYTKKDGTEVSSYIRSCHLHK